MIKEEIFKYIFIFWGSYQIITNLAFLITKNGNGIEIAHKVYRELPRDIPDTKIKRKIIIMLLIGVIFTAVGVYSLSGNEMISDLVIVIALVVYGCFSTYEAVKHRTMIGFLISFLVWGITLAGYYIVYQN